MRILQIANYSEGGGGIAVQVKQIRDHLSTDGIKCDILSTKGSLKNRVLAILQLFRIGRNYDVFHIHACSNRGFFPAIVGIGIGRLFKRRIVLTYHGGGAEVFFRRRAALVRFFLNKTDDNIVLSEFVGTVFDRYSIAYTVIPNVVELKGSVYRKRELITPSFISVRSFTPTYNIECTLRAFHIIQNRYPEANLILLGDGPLKPQLVSFVEENHIQHVKFVGRVENEHIYDYLNEADIMLTSSIFDNMPVSILEAFNAGLLVIASKTGGIPYMIEDGKNGLLFDVDDSDGMVRQIEWALLHQENARAIILAGHQSIKHYSWDFVKDRLMSLYNKSIYGQF